MKPIATAALALSMTFAGVAVAQQANEAARQDMAAQANADKHMSDRDKHAAKAQKKADEKREKVLNSDKAKDAAKAQDKADRKADEASR